MWARACFNLVGIDCDCAGSKPRSASHHALPPVANRLYATVGECEVRLVVHAVKALHHSLLKLVYNLAALTGVGVNPVDSLVVNLNL
jgi:hypothetical protein